jgi:MFS family permease
MSLDYRLLVTSPCPTPAQLAQRNTRCFLLFRIFFNCRFYYPVFTILFLDFGLTLDQFATLNALWAVAIVVLEVPAGALADQMGPRRLVIASAVLMVLEMLCLVFMPRGGGAATFWLFALNRVLSGAAEASASGADEALTYDSLPAEGRATAWQRINAKLLRWQSLAFLAATVVGAVSYDADRMNAILGSLGIARTLTPGVTMRIPLVLCLASAAATLLITLRFLPAPTECARPALNLATLSASFRGVFATARWIVATPAVLVLLLTGLLFDSFMRLFYSVSSQFYRVLEIPTEFYGWIGAGAALLGFATAGLLEKFARTLSPSAAYRGLALMIFVGLLGLGHPVRWWGLWAAVPFWFAMRALHYFLTQHLNGIIGSAERATALSFRGLTMNLAYGTIMQLFGWQTVWLTGRLGPDATDNTVFVAAARWWPWAFAGCVGALWATVAFRYRRSLNDLMNADPQPPAVPR